MTSEERMARAGDYVLGLLDDKERERAERDLERDPEFRAAVMRLAARMAALDVTVKPQPVPERMWSTIEEQIADLPQMKPAAGTFADAPPSRRPLDTRTRPASRPASSLGGWRGMAIAAGLAASLGAGFVAGAQYSAAPQPVVVVVLDTENEVPGAIFEAYGDDSVRIVPLRDFAVPDGKILQVWTLYDRAVGPVSLGTLAQAEVTRITGPDLPPPQPEQLYEITLEDAPGSPTGKPTGPILVKGFAARPPR